MHGFMRLSSKGVHIKVKLNNSHTQKQGFKNGVKNIKTNIMLNFTGVGNFFSLILIVLCCFSVSYLFL
jgi:hypothetical protein